MDPRALPAEDVEQILAFVAQSRGIDFRDYRVEILTRRVALRMSVLGLRGVSEYRRVLAGGGTEVDRLVETLVVPVTSFFRDPGVFEALERTVVPALYRKKATVLTGGKLRAWSVGVATGQEAWTAAMVLANAGPCDFEVVGSDLDARSLSIAARAEYPVEALTAIPPASRERYLRIDGPRGLIAPELRARVHFARHDIMGRRLAPEAAVVATFDIVSLRNVLIYFGRRLQAKAFDRVLSVLEPGGALVIGPAETLPPNLVAEMAPFPGLDPRLKIFRKRDDV